MLLVLNWAVLAVTVYAFIHAAMQHTTVTRMHSDFAYPARRISTINFSVQRHLDAHPQVGNSSVFVMRFKFIHARYAMLRNDAQHRPH